MHKPTLVAALVADDYGNVWGSLRGDVKARRVLQQIVIEVPADPYVTKLEGSCDAATHDGSPYSVGGGGSRAVKRKAGLTRSRPSKWRRVLGGAAGIGANDHQILLFSRFFLQLPKNTATTIETTASIAMRITSIIGHALNHTRAFLSNPRSRTFL
jgi:hypothetical protein